MPHEALDSGDELLLAVCDLTCGKLPIVHGPTSKRSNRHSRKLSMLFCADRQRSFSQERVSSMLSMTLCLVVY